MAVGTHYDLQERSLPNHYGVQVWRGDSFFTDLASRSVLEAMPRVRWNFGDGDDVFAWKECDVIDDPNSMIFLLIFYRVIPVFAFTIPIEQLKEPDPSHPDAIARLKAERAEKKLRS